MRNYKKKTTRGTTPTDVMARAVKMVKAEGRSIRSVAKDFDIPFRTLARYCQKANHSPIEKVGYTQHRLVSHQFSFLLVCIQGRWQESPGCVLRPPVLSKTTKHLRKSCNFFKFDNIALRFSTFRPFIFFWRWP